MVVSLMLCDCSLCIHLSICVVCCVLYDVCCVYNVVCCVYSVVWCVLCVVCL